MERTARDMVGTSLLQCHEVPNHIHDLSRIEDLVYRLLRYHKLLFINLFVFYILYTRKRAFPLGRLLLNRPLMDFIFINGLLHLP